MTYSAYTDRVLPYHLDGTIVKQISSATGVLKTFSAGELLELNDEDYTPVGWTGVSYATAHWLTFFFPELVDISAIFGLGYGDDQSDVSTIYSYEWSADTTNGIDGTWTAATMPNGFNATTMNLDSWRTGMKSCTNVLGAIAIRLRIYKNLQTMNGWFICHLYGHKTSGQTPDDILFLDAEAGDTEFAIPCSFGDILTGVAETHQIKLYNSGTVTAGTVTMGVYDPASRITISDDDITYGTALSIGDIGTAGTTGTLYVKCTMPAAPSATLGPDRAPIKVTVGGWY